jgi:prepilin-type N-terminal cleavage/methylation domain-containing protein
MGPAARTEPAAAGFSLVELLLVLGLLALLAGVGASFGGGRGAALTAVQGELRAAVEQGQRLARNRGRSVRLALHQPLPGAGAGQEPAPLVLPAGVRWGLPRPDFPLPDGAERPLRAHLDGAAHPWVTLGPGGGAEATVWYLHAGEDAVCLRLSDEGEITLLRRRPRIGAWRPE